MMFKNLKSGNLIEVSDEKTARMMQESPNYEAVIPKPAPVPQTKSVKKTKK